MLIKQELPVGFRILPEQSIVPIASPQKRRLAAHWHEQRRVGRKVFMEEVKRETGIEQAQARKCEMLAEGFRVNTLPQSQPSKGDRRNLFMLDDSIELVWETDEAGGGLAS